jgi:hypothetical protein
MKLLRDLRAPAAQNASHDCKLPRPAVHRRSAPPPMSRSTRRRPLVLRPLPLLSVSIRSSGDQFRFLIFLETVLQGLGLLIMVRGFDCFFKDRIQMIKVSGM